MKIKLDENLPAELIDTLRARGHDVDSVYSEGLTGSSDQIVFGAAISESRILFTQDLGFLRHSEVQARNSSRDRACQTA